MYSQNGYIVWEVMMMKAMVQMTKLAKRLRREMDAQRRVTWGFSPLTRRKEGVKAYSRQPKHRKDMTSSGVFA
jgi:hypothetical protein